MLHPVERPGDRRRRADLTRDDDQVLGDDGAAPELAKQRVEGVARLEHPPMAGYDVPLAPKEVAGLDEPELADVARDRRLRDDAAGRSQRVQELLLRSEPQAIDEADDEPLALGLRELTIRMHLY